MKADKTRQTRSPGDFVKPLRLALLAGGRSAEHKGSLESALYLLRFFDPNFYQIDFHVQDQDGSFFRADEIRAKLQTWLDDPYISVYDAEESDAREKLVAMVFAATSYQKDFLSLLEGKNYDLVFPVFHGRYGEDGSIQGMLEFLGVPYVGCGLTGSILGIDKTLTKAIARANGIAVLDWLELRADELVANDEIAVGGLPVDELSVGELDDQLDSSGIPDSSLSAETRKVSLAAFADRAISNLGLPLFVKPARLGSSLGLSRADDKAGLISALTKALCYDDKILVEPLCPFPEYGVGFIGNEKPVASAAIAYSLSPDFYDFDAKFGASAKPDTIPAQIDAQDTAALHAFAENVFHRLGLSGCARIDCFMGKGQIYLNEVNTLPGFGSHSVFAVAFEAAGWNLHAVLNHIVEAAYLRQHREAGLKNKFRLGI